MATRSIVSEVSKESLTCDKPGWTIGLKCRDCPARLRNPKPAARKPWDTLLAKSHPRAQRSRGFFSDSSLESCSLSLGTLALLYLGSFLTRAAFHLPSNSSVPASERSPESWPPTGFPSKVIVTSVPSKFRSMTIRTPPSLKVTDLPG